MSMRGHGQGLDAEAWVEEALCKQSKTVSCNKQVLNHEYMSVYAAKFA